MRSFRSLLTLLLALLAPASAPATLQLVYVPEPGLETLAERLRAAEPRDFTRALELTGALPPERPIQVILAHTDSAWGRRVPSWASGYAIPVTATVVLMPARVPAYPHPSMEALLEHEVAHVLIAQASGGRALPRWFQEGVATLAARPWQLGDRTRASVGVLSSGRMSLTELDMRFRRRGGNVSLAYALSADFVRELLEREGPDTVSGILARVARGRGFELAFAQTTGRELERVEAAYWRRRLLWDRWLPIATSSLTLWAGISLLAVWAIRVRRRRDAELHEIWEREERAWDGPGTAPEESVH